LGLTGAPGKFSRKNYRGVKWKKNQDSRKPGAIGDDKGLGVTRGSAYSGRRRPDGRFINFSQGDNPRGRKNASVKKVRGGKWASCLRPSDAVG